ncbi:MAG: PEP-CTERM sorting domain-containing protein [Phycisphaerae bacterium]|nr:PEP-CTERM sorting domain-containing protein [Phycisphaerae bacterium]
MSENKRFWSLVVLLSVLMIGNTAFGWGGPTHAALTEITFDDPVVAPLLSGINQSAIESWTGEPPTDLPQWSSVRDRYYIESAGSVGGYDWWDDFDETTRLKYLTHSAADCAVPLGHAPANQVYTNTIAEAILEAQVSLWGTYPSVSGTTYYTHSQTNNTWDLDGTRGSFMSKFQSAVLDNASWFKSTKNWLGLHGTEDNHDAGWNGTKLALMVQRAVIVDYFLARQSPVADAGGDHMVSPGETEQFNASDSYDPDSINWSSNGTYWNNGGGVVGYYWDYDYDGTWDWVDNDPYDQRTYNQLLAMGIQTNQWVRYNFAIQDDEGKMSYDSDFLYLSTGGAPEPATMSLLGVGALAMLRRRKK